MNRWLQKFFPNREQLFKTHPYLRKFKDFLDRGNAWRFNAHAVACGISVGLFSAFIPLPIQTILAIVLAILLRGNIILAVAATWVSNPITFAPIVYLIYRTGELFLREHSVVPTSLTPVQIRFTNIHVFWQSSLDWVQHYGITFFVGMPILAITVGVLSYFLIFLTWGLISFLRVSRFSRTRNN